MSDSIPWILISVGVLIIFLGVVAILVAKSKKGKHKPDYYTFFIMGIIWLPTGIVINNYAFSVMGLIFMIIGLVNKDKWKKNHRSLKDMNKDERKIMIMMIIILGILVLVGLAAFFLVNRGIF